ncbi:hypothetical protein GCM10010218_29060 [Streptomyces mashuensis]|uniref:Secreted protein n=1 Tax=Streptomyces mashuensis TaxID=33904 RepID=A0A919B300_9ACTN|nr:hypothetical protein [Streptomyces mashuensis]GHF46012.1 hypothetical protein GCM10010218_29060 [Streptomyces mashuensis]
MQRTLHRILATATATLLLGLGSAALATPAHADVDANLLGGTVTALADGVVEADVLGSQLLQIPNPAEGLV